MAHGGSATQESSSGLDPATLDDVDYELLLDRLLASSKNRQFLSDLEVLIRRGDQEASGFLMDALEAGTIAALLMKRVKSPGLLAFLQNLEKPHPSSGALAVATSAGNEMANGRCEDPERSIAAAEREKARAEAARAALESERSKLERRTHWNGSGTGRNKP